VWNYVIPHFSRFLQELELKPEERADADSKADRIARCLWSYYYFDSGDFNPYCYVKVGSYGKGTATRPPSDLDMLFLLPTHEFSRIERLAGNKQSQLLQEVKDILEDTFPRTDLRADGQVVIAPFQSYNVEIIPASTSKAARTSPPIPRTAVVGVPQTPLWNINGSWTRIPSVLARQPT
jgi:tRNA nucleotidyltransferase (CCA-adding enzyme)